MEDAISAVQKNSYSIRKASRTFNVPYSTLYYKIHNRNFSKRRGRKPLLSPKEEEQIIEIVRMSKIFNVKLKKGDLMSDVGKIKKFKNDIPSEQWWRTFKKRHPVIFSSKPHKKLPVDTAFSLNRASTPDSTTSCCIL